MKKIKLNRLYLENFKGIRNFTLNANGLSVEVFGDNATGKTTLFDAFSWLLFDKDSEGKANFEIKTLDSYGNVISGINHSVKGDFEINGAEVTLEKVYKEKWTKKRGSLTTEFTGHETEYYINDIPKSKGEYTAYISEIITEDIFRLLTNPKYFSTGINKKDRREMLFNLCGGVTDEDVIMSNLELFGELQELLSKYTLDELKTVTASSKRKVNGRIQDIPQRIDETSRYITVYDKPENEYRETLKAVEADIADKQNEYNLAREAGNTDNGAKIFSQRIKDFDDKTATERIKLSQTLNSARQSKAKAQGEVVRIEAELRQAERTIELLKKNISVTENEIASAEEDVLRTRGEWITENNKQFDGSTKCPTCCQELPESMIAEAVQTFNKEKAKRLEMLTERGKAKNERIEALKASNEEVRRHIEAEEEKKIRLVSALSDAQVAHSVALTDEYEAERAYTAFEENAREERAKLLEALTTPTETAENGEKLNTLTNALKNLLAVRDEIKAILNGFEMNVKYNERIAQLQAEQRELSAEYERLDKTDYLIGEFVKAKANMIEKHINGLFSIVNFRLFSTQVNGGVVDECDITVNGVPYEALNNAMQINAGIDVISTFCRLTETYAPIWIDNCESITKVCDTEAQQIRLYVSESNKTLFVK